MKQRVSFQQSSIFLGVEYSVMESKKPFYIEGRQAAIMVNGLEVGHFGEFSPQLLQNWQMQNPAIACEININRCCSL